MKTTFVLFWVVLSINLCYSQSRSVGLNFTNCSGSLLNLHIDSNMDGDSFNDDDIEENEQGIIINVNNDSDAGVGQADNLDMVVNGPEDLSEMTILYIEKLPSVPVDHKVLLKVENDFITYGAPYEPITPIRIFDNNQLPVIGPPQNQWGGPEISTFEIPNNAIIKNNDDDTYLEYLIEGIDHGRVKMTLELVKEDNGNETMVVSDLVRMNINIDRTAKFGADPNRYRNYANANKAKPNLIGIEADFESSEPLLFWNGFMPKLWAATAFWITLNAKNELFPGIFENVWTQGGPIVIYNDAPDDLNNYILRPGIYLEVEPGELGSYYQMMLDESDGYDWENGKFKVEIADLASGEITLSLNDNVILARVESGFANFSFTEYGVAAEMFQTVNRSPGSSNAPAKISNILVKDNIGWENTEFEVHDVKINWTDGKGYSSFSSGSASDPIGSLGEYNIKFINGSSIEFWDSRN